MKVGDTVRVISAPYTTVASLVGSRGKVINVNMWITVLINGKRRTLKRNEVVFVSPLELLAEAAE
jgi:hypothetical protein